ncbi:MAG: galactose mutarotase [Dysgonamonadaceae bacterium]|jgi:aldose 1-epimerase|nr:galactose mutarotase [Dysgonamonadaceae bacterium]
MKNIVFLLGFIALVLVSCGKKQALPPTASGLVPDKFVMITPDRDTTGLYVIKNSKGMEVCLTNIGARIVSVWVPAKDGSWKNVVLGYDSILPYTSLNNEFRGAVIGRFAGRIANGKFQLDRVNYQLRTNAEGLTLNGGPRGFNTQFFNIEQPDSQTVVAHYFSKSGEEGFVGNLNLDVTYSLSDDNALTIEYYATVDRATHINLTNHSYFNLSGRDAGNLDGQTLWIETPRYLETGKSMIPTGKILDAKNGVYDFTSPKAFSADANYDLTYIFDGKRDASQPVARAASASTGITLEVVTTEPGMQLYVPEAKDAFCLETQHFPDSPNHPDFPSTILRVDSVFSSKTVYKFGIE